MRAHLQRLNMPYQERSVPDLGLHQVFLRDPMGVTLELNYPSHEG